jgi:hypothetical protein
LLSDPPRPNDRPPPGIDLAALPSLRRFASIDRNIPAVANIATNATKIKVNINLSSLLLA